MTQASHYRVVIVGGGSAGITVATRLRHDGVSDVAVIDPASMHYYQPLWTLVGGGRTPMSESGRSQASVLDVPCLPELARRRATTPLASPG